MTQREQSSFVTGEKSLMTERKTIQFRYPSRNLREKVELRVSKDDGLKEEHPTFNQEITQNTPWTVKKNLMKTLQEVSQFKPPYRNPAGSIVNNLPSIRTGSNSRSHSGNR